MIPDKNKKIFPHSAEPMTPFIYILKDQEIEVHPRRHKQAKRLNMRFDLLKNTVILTLPPRATQKHMVDFLKKAEGWIEKKISKKMDVFSFEDKSVISLLGDPLIITHQRNFISRSVKVKEGKLIVSGPKERLGDMVTLFLKRYAQEKFTNICESYAEQIGEHINTITIRTQKSRWGSCSSQRNISLNWRLLFAPYDVASYVCAHEVAHLKEMNHSKNFWRVVEGVSPTYKENVKWLKDKGQELFKYGA